MNPTSQDALEWAARELADAPGRRDPAEAAASEVREGVVRLARRFRNQRQSHGVGGLGVMVLSHLYRSEAATASAIAEAEGVQPQTLTRVIAALQAQGLIGRRNDPEDGRQVLLSLTADGMAVLRQHAMVHTRWLAKAMNAQLTPAEREIVRIAAGLMERLADYRPGSPTEPGRGGDEQ